ncbi:hypothetical protein MMC21_002913 [Puttea exsequens]|nr:hypothetical protein [Puttea exsequens]
MAQSLNDESRVPNIVFIKGLPAANEQIQIQALELLRTRRIFTHVSVHSAPKQFLIVFITANCDAKLTHHLNDQIFISHTHDPEEGFQNLEEEWSEREEDDGASTSSVIHRKATEQSFPAQHPLFGAEDIRAIADQSDKVTITAEILAYLHNIIVFLRLNRAVRGGVSPRATEHFRLLVKCLAPLHGLDYVTPSLIPLAARKVYPHRIVITKPENERSMQYGSDLRAVAAMLEGIGPSDVVETVLEEVEMPL